MNGAGSENRTRDIRITSAVLYQLSYPGPANLLQQARGGYDNAACIMARAYPTLYAIAAYPPPPG